MNREPPGAEQSSLENRLGESPRGFARRSEKYGDGKNIKTHRLRKTVSDNSL